jgi:hypothetical protein
MMCVLLGGCAAKLPPENYSITITSHVCNDAGMCHTETETIPPIHNQPSR